MIDVLRLGADLWLFIVVAVVFVFLIREIDLRLRTDRFGAAACFPALIWAGWLAVTDAWALLIELVERV